MHLISCATRPDPDTSSVSTVSAAPREETAA